MRQTAVVDSQKRLTRCFRELEVASEHENIPKSLKYFDSRAGAEDDEYITDEKSRVHQTFAVRQADD